MSRGVSRVGVAFWLGVLVLGLWTTRAAPAQAANEFRLKAGARGKVCLGCHEAFADILKKPHVHTPIAQGDCTGCHSPHASDHATLLAADKEAVCLTCHDDLVPPQTQSEHKVFAEGKCTSCHDPHAAENANNLVRAGSQLCFGCHKDMEAKIAKNRYQHAPVTKSCLGCHNPHVSTRSPWLLEKEQPALCLGCHDADKPIFRNKHKRYPVTRGRCSTCHDPHGSSTAGLLFDNVHPPVAEKRCEECHEAATSATPFALRDVGYKLCEGCHYEEVTNIFNKKRIHWPVVDERGCRNCHAPHASPEPALMKLPMMGVCGECHADAVNRQKRSQTKHPPVAEGECTECHSPHSSDYLFLETAPTTEKLCGKCHDWETHSTHPIGAKVIDPRNPNVSVSCTSCHRAHGTEYQHFLYFETTNDMCVQCHSRFRR